MFLMSEELVRIKKILVVRFSSMGDIILLTPIFRELHRLYPQAEIDFLTSLEFSNLCENNPYVSRQIFYDRRNSKSEFYRILRVCREGKYDLVYDAHRSLRSRLLLTRAFGIKTFSKQFLKKTDKRSLRRNLLIFFHLKFFNTFLSQREEFLKMIGNGKLDLIRFSTELFPSELEIKKIDHIFEEENLRGKSLICFGAGASFEGKCWAKENFLELANILCNEGHQIVLLGGSEDAVNHWIARKLKGRILNLSGKLGFLESAELLRRSKLSVSNDSSIVHLSEAMGTPTISIFGPTVKEFGFAPFLLQSELVEIDLPCRPCSRNGKGNCFNPVQRECIQKISVSKIHNTVLNVISKISTS